MAQISRNDYGSIVVNDNVIEKLIIDEILAMDGSAMLCNKKGKIVRDNSTPFIESDYYDAVVITDTIRESCVKVYLVTVFGESIKAITDAIFSKVAGVYDILHVKRPSTVKVYIMGMKTTSGIIVKRNIEVQHSYD